MAYATNLTRAHLITALLDAAEPVVKAYHGDLRHDARVIADAAPGDSFLWAPRESGTFIIVLARGERSNKRGAELFDIMDKQYAGLDWHLLTVEDGAGCAISPLVTGNARDLAVGHTRRAESGSPAVSEVHM